MIDKYLSLKSAVELISPMQTSAILVQLLKDNPCIYSAPGSSSKHHNWEGGYVDHITECMNIAIHMYQSLTWIRKLPFTLSDALLVLFLHDIEKPFLYSGEVQFKDKAERAEYRLQLIDKYNIQLTEEHLIALKYVEGENEDYHPTERVMNELGAFCHSCDVLSARMWHDKKAG